MTQTATQVAATPEAGVLARMAAKSFGQLVENYEKHFQLTRAEAFARATESPSVHQEHILNSPPENLSFCDLHVISRCDPERGAALWEEVKRAALDELQTGHRAAGAIESASPIAWRRAQFLALRSELAAEWQPRNGIERQLLDTMAQAQACYLHWLEVLTLRTMIESVNADRKYQEEGRWQAPRQKDADALEQAAAMVDRFNRLFLRTLRALCDLRRRGGPVIVQNGGQLNVAQQQVNVNSPQTPGAV
jgi:hypothetical protein